MSATSVTGKGLGYCGKFTTKELSNIAAVGPCIMFAGSVESDTVLSSPPSYSNEVVFPYGLAGGAASYAVILTTLNAGYAYVSDTDEDDDGNFTGFNFVSQNDGVVMYLVVKNGSKPQV